MFSEKKVALLHYWLTGMRGGENVFNELCRMFPEADVFTHAAIPDSLSGSILEHRLHESVISRLPMGRRHCQKYLPLMPWAQKLWDFSDYGLIFSSESGPVKGINKPKSARHICYCHTPMRYVWDMYDTYYEQTGVLGKIAMRVFRKPLQRYDLRSADCVDFFIANSNFVKERIRRIYNRQAQVVYPPVDVDFFSAAQKAERKFYLFVGQLVPYKRPDIVVEALGKLKNEKLIIVGQGPLKAYLQKKASDNVVFYEKITKEELRNLYASAKALLFPGIEDFGIVPVEAQAAGCPVVAIRAGGALETVIDHETGIFMEKQTSDDLLNCLDEAKSCRWEEKIMLKNAQRYNTGEFIFQIQDILKRQI